MKTRRIGKLAALSLAILVVLGTCNLLGVDTMDRINMFASGLNNSDRSLINSNFDQTSTQNLASMTPAWWSAFFPVPPDPGHLYAISLIEYSNPSNVVATIEGPQTFNSYTGNPLNAVFVMSKVGPDLYIEKLYLNGSATPLIQ